MNWFGGSITEAIAAAKTRKAIFVVYVRDSSEASKTTDDVLSNRDVVEVMDGGQFVAIKLENGTESAKQFSQIYPLVLVPSLFFISAENGLPLEVLGGPLTLENLKEKMKKLIEGKPAPETTLASSSGSEISKTSESDKPKPSTSNQVEETETSPVPHSPAAVTESTAAATVVTNADADEIKTDNEETTKAASEDQETPVDAASAESNDDGASSLSFEEKVERAKILLAEKQDESAREKAEEERQKEIDRRKMGQEMAKKKQRQEEDEIKAMVRERRKDKEEDRIARERVKAQIAADRAAMEARAAQLRGETSSPRQPPVAEAAPAPSPPASSSNISRLKFRLPDGSSSISQFPAEAPLSEVRQYVEQNVVLPFSTFTLASTVQHRSFTPQDYNTSLRDLGLVPSAILAILPGESSGREQRVPSGGREQLVPSGGGLWDFLWYVLSPITFIVGLIQRYMLGREQRSDRTEEPKPKRPREDPSPNTRQRPSTAYGRRGETRFRQEGNIHRLQNGDEDDDENNTWNGNSTQQM